MRSRVFSAIVSLAMFMRVALILALLATCGGGGGNPIGDPSGGNPIGNPSENAGSSSSSSSLGPTTDIRDYGNLSAAIKAIGSTQTTLVIPNAQILTENTTIPPNIYLVIQNGGTITKNSSYTLTIQGPFEAGLYQVFVGFSPGDVTFGYGAKKEIYPEWWGAKSNDGGRTDSKAAIDSAVAAILENNGGVIAFYGPTYGISDLVAINKNNIQLKGGNNKVPTILCKSATAGIAFSKGGSTYIYNATIEGLTIHGNLLGGTGLVLNWASETCFKDLTILRCAVGIRTAGDATSIFSLNTSLKENTTHLKIESGSTLKFLGGHFFSCTNIADIKTCYGLTFEKVYIEGFDIAFDIKNATEAKAINSLIVDDCYWLSTSGGSTNNCRIFKFTSDNLVRGIYASLNFTNNHIYTTAMKYLLEVDYSGGHSWSNKIIARLRDNNWYGALNATAFIHTNETSDQDHLHVTFEDNLAPAGVSVQDGSGGYITVK